MYQVFIVDENTFKYHLEYLFAGTGAQDRLSVFLGNPSTSAIHSTTERNLVGMIADISKIRPGDKIIFYLQAAGQRPGMFFGVFKAASRAFFDENDTDNYLKNDLRKGLSFRIMIGPDTVFPLGITEHEYLDSLVGKSYPYQLCWSLIYRKLKGNRGCTMIMEHEFNDLLSKLKAKNNHTTLNSASFSFAASMASIVPHSIQHSYLGRQDSLDITNRLLYKANRRNAFEAHLQAYILQNYDTSPLDSLLLPQPNIRPWIGNEVSCGVGMQRIDIMIKQESDTDIYFKIIELKCLEPNNDIIDVQIPWYLEWVNDYVVPNYLHLGKKIHIIPSIIALSTNNTSFLSRAARANYPTPHPHTLVSPLEYIGFTINNNHINFSKII